MTARFPFEVRAFAKINLTLRVLGLRPDGYHELRTVFQSLAIHDRLRFERIAGPFEIVCDDSRCPVDRTNLVWRAAALVWRAAGRRDAMTGVRVSIRKRIPMQAGLGGGSSDAAATLRALVPHWAPDLEAGQLDRIGASLGADVPFFLHGGTVLGLERGDRLFPLRAREREWVVLVQPDFGVGTPDAYRWFDERTPMASRRRGLGPYAEGGNDLEAPVARHHPAITRIVRGLRRNGARWAAMSGSGSVCFGLFATRPGAEAAGRALAGPRCATIVTRTLTTEEHARGAAPVHARVRG